MKIDIIRVKRMKIKTLISKAFLLKREIPFVCFFQVGYQAAKKKAWGLQIFVERVAFLNIDIKTIEIQTVTHIGMS